VAVVDLFSRHVLSWRLSNSLDTEFCLDALEMALSAGRKPKILIQIRVASSPLMTSWPGCRWKRSRLAGQEGSVAMTISWSRDCGARSSTRRLTSVPIAMVGRLKSAWTASCGGIAM